MILIAKDKNFVNEMEASSASKPSEQPTQMLNNEICNKFVAPLRDQFLKFSLRSPVDRNPKQRQNIFINLIVTEPNKNMYLT